MTYIFYHLVKIQRAVNHIYGCEIRMGNTVSCLRYASSSFGFFENYFKIRKAKNGLVSLCKLIDDLYFKEWVTEDPFVISPRITFAVSVRLLGGLMALGYTIATILKRSSHVLSDDRICVKLDWLEQLNRHYVQVMLEYLYNAILLL